MATSTAFTSAVSSFAVVGVADVVFHNGKQAIDLYLRCHRAQKTLPKHIEDLKGLISVVASVRLFAEKFNVSPFVTQDNQTLIDLETILQECETETKKLVDVANAATSQPMDSWLDRGWKNLGWAFNEDDFERSCLRLERLKSSLNGALSATGRHNDLAVRSEIRATRNDIADTHSAVETGIHDVQRQVTTFSDSAQLGLQQTQIAVNAGVHEIGQQVENLSDSAQQGFLQVTETVQTTSNGIQAQLNGLEGSARNAVTNLNTQSRHIRESVRDSKQASSMQHSIVVTSISRASDHSERRLADMNASLSRAQRQQRRLSSKLAASTSRRLDRINNAQAELGQQMASLVLRESAGQMVLEGVNLEAITKPLMLLEPELIHAVTTLTLEGTMKLSSAEAHWIQTEFDNLLASSYEASARAKRNPLITHSTSRRSSTPPGYGRTKRSSLAVASTSTLLESKAQENGTVLRLGNFNHRRTFTTPVGLLVIQTDKGGQDTAITRSSSLSVRFVFVTHLDTCATGVSATLKKHWSNLQGPSIQRYVRAYNIISKESRIFGYLNTDDVASIQSLFSSGDASPFDCSQRGFSILDHAAWCHAPNAYEFLLSQGAGSDTLQTRLKELPSITSFQPESESEVAQDYKILALAINNNLSSIWGRGGSLFHDLMYFDRIWGFDSLPFEAIVDGLLRDGEDLETRDHTGCTPLLNACWLGCSPTLVHLLIRKGADVQAFDTGGWNALHQVLWRTNFECTNYHRLGVMWPRERYVAQASLAILLHAGCRTEVASVDGKVLRDLLTTSESEDLWDQALRRHEQPRHPVPMLQCIVSSSRNMIQALEIRRVSDWYEEEVELGPGYQ